jgi:integrase
MADRLFKRGDTWYAWFYDANGKRYQRTTRQTDKRAAEATLREWERRAADPTYAAAHETTLEEALRSMLRDRKLKGRAVGTIDCYRVKAGHLTRILGAGLTLHEVTARKVDAFIDQRLDEGASRNTIHKELTALRATLKVAKRRGEFPGDIAAIMPDQFSSEYKPRERHQTPGEAQALLAELEPDRAARVAFILGTGARLSESDGSRRGDINLEEGILRLRGTKTDAADRRVPVVGFAIPLLEHALTYCEGSNGLLFRPWPNVRRDLAAACKRAGVPVVTPNDLRRTYATWWRHHGVATADIASLLGHKDSRMVERVYGRMDAHSLGRALQRRLGASEATSPAETAAVTPENACSAFVANTGESQRSQTLQREPEPSFFSGFLVSGDGIEPPTRGFSVLCSTD